MRLAEPNATIGNDWVHVTMSLFRNHLEELNIKKSYPTLRLFCDWILHPSLGRSSQEFLEKISAVINDGNSGHPSDRFAEILLRELLSDIRSLLKTANFESDIFQTHADWKLFVGLMMPFLIRKPLKWNGKDPNSPYIESFELHDNDGTPYWKIVTQPGNHIFSRPLVFPFGSSDFEA